jgi:TonB-linked SusC/RagA family outer membrane protein
MKKKQIVSARYPGKGHKLVLKMKLTFIILMGCLMQVSASVYSQTTKFSFNIQNKQVLDVLKEIEDKSNFRFFYQREQVDVTRKIDLKVTERNVETILDELFRNQGVLYKVLPDNLIIITPNTGKQSVAGLNQQQKSVSGKVTDTSGAPLPGVSVLIKGTSQGTVTDSDGNYSISNVPEHATLQFSFVGMKIKETTVGTQTTINATLEDETIGIEEVVAVGYGTQKKVNLTGSITAVNASELSTISTSNLSNTLAGRAPGVNITGNSGLMGASSEIRIRGGFGEPLFVIDGIVRDKGAFDALEVNEIDQLSFLKDAATASIYGSQAGNSVVLVTTKAGTEQKPVFNYQGSYTFMEPTQELFSDMFTATDELIYQNRVAQFQGLATPNGDKEFAYFKDKNYNVNDYIWQTPSTQKHSISVSGGNDKVTYYALGSYIGETGSYKNLENDKFNLRSNVTAKITDRIKMNFNLSANQQNQQRFYWPFSDDDEQTIGDLYRCTFNWPKTYPFYLNADGTPANNVTDYPLQTPMGSWQAWNVVDQVIGDRYIKT